MTFLVAIAGALLPLGVGLIILGIRPAPVVTTAAPTRPSRLAKPRRLTPTMRIVCAISVALGLLIAATTPGDRPAAGRCDRPTPAAQRS